VPHLHRPPGPGNPSCPPIRSHPPTFTLPAAALGDFPNPSAVAPKSEREDEGRNWSRWGSAICGGGRSRTSSSSSARAWPLRSRSSPSQGRRRPSRSRPWSSRHRGIGAGPAGDGVVLLCFPCIKRSPPVFFLYSTASSSPTPHHCLQEHEVSTEAPSCCGVRPSSQGCGSLVSPRRALCARCCFLPAPHRRADPPSSDSWQSSHAGRICRCCCLQHRARATAWSFPGSCSPSSTP
jgi:hypothetical protein